jgi:hypothetical protein
MAEILLLLVLILTSFLGLFRAWIAWPSEIRNVRLAVWHRVAMSIGLFSATIQAILFILVWTPLSRNNLEKCMHADIIMVLLALPCILAWNGPTRWPLLASAILIPAICFFVVLARVAY